MQRWVLFIIGFLLSCNGHHTTQSSSSDSNVDQVVAVNQLIERVLANATGGSPPTFTLEVVDADGVDYFSMYSSNDSSVLYLTGSSGVAIASGFHWWLKYSCKCSVSWLGNQLNLPDSPPHVEYFKITSPYSYGYYLNVCTFGYSTVWWDWDRWEKEIDWMAMNGIDLPLAFVGQEIVWTQVYSELGIDLEELDDFFGGPAFLPWQRMGNVDDWGGLLKPSWMQQQYYLQLQIVARMRSFGMSVILPGFAGHVPHAFIEHYSNSSVTKLDSWNGFPGTYFLDPLDSMFSKIGALFVETVSQFYGSDHFYNCDPFNEMDPPSNSTEYLSTISQTIYNSMAIADPKAIWVLQGWFLTQSPDFWQPTQAEAFLTAVLDLRAEVDPIWEQNLLYGRKFIWNMLHNYGGRPGLYATLPRVATGPPNALYNGSANIVGTGFTPEGLGTVPIAYDLASEMRWRWTSPDLDEWVGDYAVRRYGLDKPNIRKAWELLQHSVYNCTTNQNGASGSIVAGRPDLEISSVGHATTAIYWNSSVVCKAWDLLMTNADALRDVETFKYDITDVTNQILSDLMLVYHENLVNCWETGNADQFELIAANISHLIEDMDSLVSTMPLYLLGKWLSDAVYWAEEDEKQIFEYQYNARLLITLWSWPPSSLNDYAYKLWGGLVRDFYKSRWETFFDSLRPYIGNASQWDEGSYLEEVYQVEKHWTYAIDYSNYESLPVGDTIEVAKEIFERYHNFC